MVPPGIPHIKFAVREVPAFVGHSFAREDLEVITRITEFLQKIGFACESGVRPEPESVSAKVSARLSKAEVFVGIFTRRNKNQNGTYSTSPWIIEEKALAISLNKKIMMLVEDGVTDFGGLQGD